METAHITPAQYEIWARDFYNLTLREPTQQEVIDAPRLNMLAVQATPEGCMLRATAMSGGSIDLYLNAALAIHLFRYLAHAGQIGGWMDLAGNPVTTERVEDDCQQLPSLDRMAAGPARY